MHMSFNHHTHHKCDRCFKNLATRFNTDVTHLLMHAVYLSCRVFRVLGMPTPNPQATCTNFPHITVARHTPAGARCLFVLPCASSSHHSSLMPFFYMYYTWKKKRQISQDAKHTCHTPADARCLSVLPCAPGAQHPIDQTMESGGARFGGCTGVTHRGDMIQGLGAVQG